MQKNNTGYLWEQLKQFDGVLLYGTGNGADQILDLCKANGIPCLAVFVSDGFKTGKDFRGFQVLSAEEALSRYPNAPILLCFAVFREDMLQRIRELAARRLLFAPDVPVIGEGIVTPEAVALRAAQIFELHDLLADDASKECLDAILQYKLSGKTELLRHVECDRTETLRQLFLLPEGATYVDLGAYRGDTFEEYCMLFGNPGKAYLFEPAPVNFRKLSEQYFGRRDCFLVPKAAFCHCDGIMLSASSGRGAHIGGAIAVPSVTVDSYFAEIRTDYIKIDVEGAESSVLAGAEKTIARDRPYLSVSAYHRTWDFLELGLKLAAFGNYRIYLRHHPYIPAWETIYYAVPVPLK